MSKSFKENLCFVNKSDVFSQEKRVSFNEIKDLMSFLFGRSSFMLKMRNFTWIVFTLVFFSFMLSLMLGNKSISGNDMIDKIIIMSPLTVSGVFLFLNIFDRWCDFMDTNYISVENYLAILAYRKITGKHLRYQIKGTDFNDFMKTARFLAQNDYIYLSDDKISKMLKINDYCYEVTLTKIMEMLLCSFMDANDYAKSGDLKKIKYIQMRFSNFDRIKAIANLRKENIEFKEKRDFLKNP